jgi:RHS repeat-associated protein
MRWRLLLVTTNAPSSMSEASRPVRLYQLSYKQSGATRRSLLQSVTLTGYTDPSCGSACGGSLTLGATTFNYQEDAPSFSMGSLPDTADLTGAGPEQLTADWQKLLGSDFDGDGVRDTFLFNAPSVYLQFSSSHRTVQLDTTNFTAPSGAGFTPADGAALPLQETLYNDGLALLLGFQGSEMVLGMVSSSGAFVQVISTQLVLPGHPWLGTEDLNGDGLADIIYSSGTPAYGAIRTGKALGTSGWVFRQLSTAPTFYQATTLDINGDGTPDNLYFDHSQACQSIVSQCQPDQVQLVARDPPGQFGTAPTNTPVLFLSDVGGPPGSSVFYNNRRWIDVNGDGLPDIYDFDGTSATLYINTGGMDASATSGTLFRQVAVSFSLPASLPPGSDGAFFRDRRGRFAQVIDIDGDGVPELLVPDHRDQNYDYVGGPSYTLSNGEPGLFEGDDFDQAGTIYMGFDKSVFAWNAYKFIEQPDGTYAMVMVDGSPGANNPSAKALNLLFPINVPLSSGDFSGDGLADVSFTLKNTFVGTMTEPNHYVGLSNAQLGVYTVTSTQRAPDLLIGVVDGLTPEGQLAAGWSHRPLSTVAPAGTGALDGCDIPAGESFYVAHHDGSNSPGYSFFTSSMWVVSSMSSTNGLGADMNRTCYRYKDAMLSDWGRGFQGFKTIVVEEQLNDQNNLRSTSEFHQEFPLTGKLKRVTVARASDLRVLNETRTWWHQTPGQYASGSWLVYQSATQQITYEGTTPVALSEQITEIDPLRGSATRSCSLVTSGLPLSLSEDYDSTVALAATTYDDPPDFTNWWLDKATTRADHVGYLHGALPLADVNCSSTVTGSLVSSDQTLQLCAAAAPTCPLATDLTQDAQRQTSYTWFDASRKLATQTISIDATSSFAVGEAVSAFSYDQFGNLVSTAVSARDAAPLALAAGTSSCAVPPFGSASTFSAGSTSIVYSPDGYFPTTSTNAAGHISSASFDPGTGLPNCVTKVQGGPTTCSYSDALGRPFHTTTSGAQPIDQRLSSWSNGNAVMRRRTFQNGSPIRTDYLDRLGRAVASSVEGFNGNEVLAKVDFNARGQVTAEHVPLDLGAALGSWNGTTASLFMTTHEGFDARGRPGTKTVFRDESLFEHGQADATVTTTYTYEAVTGGGVKTNISVARSSGGPLTMSRTYDPHGWLVQTIQSGITTSYAYDAAGHTTGITDAGGNTISAAYDALGRKTSVTDPDRGPWSYTWDGLGHLRTQKDAREIQVGFAYDAIGRQTCRFTKDAFESSPFTAEAAWLYDGERPSTLTSVFGADGFERDYEYDDYLRPTRVMTLVPGDSASGTWAARLFEQQLAYDGSFGRVKEEGFPSGEVLAFDYDARGYLRNEVQVSATGSRGTIYRAVTAMSPRGAVTQQMLGNGIGEWTVYDDSTGLATLVFASLGEAIPPDCPWGLPPGFPLGYGLRSTRYSYDQFLNLARQEKVLYQRDATTGAILGGDQCHVDVSETYTYDDLQRLRSESRGDTSTESYEYDDLGNITRKSDYADSYAYGDLSKSTGRAGPHAVKAVGPGTSFQYDENGNMVAASHGTSTARSITFDLLDRPVEIQQGLVKTVFRYSPDGDRYLQHTVALNGATKTIYYVDKDYEWETWNGGQTEERTYAGASAVVYKQGTASRAVRYVHRDRLGSVDAVTDASGSEYLQDSHGMDAFGGPRARDWTSSGWLLHPDPLILGASNDFGATTDRGFTGHEHLDDTMLIHMNGRMYDYRLGRFLSVDPIISNPMNSQSLNPYSYIGNNPLSGVDPTGYRTTCETKGADFNQCQVILVNPEQSQPAAKAGKTSGADLRGPSLASSQPTDVHSPGNDASAQDNAASTGARSGAGQQLKGLGRWIVDKPAELSRALWDWLAGEASSAIFGNSLSKAAANGLVREGVVDGDEAEASRSAQTEESAARLSAGGQELTAQAAKAATYYAAGVVAGKVLGAAVEVGEAAAEGAVTAGEAAAAKGATTSFFEGTSYTAKVLRQMQGGVGEFHSFPESVRAFESAGTTRAITGGDGIVREMIEIPGSYSGREGVFQFTKEADGAINHRLFVPTAP